MCGGLLGQNRETFLSVSLGLLQSNIGLEAPLLVSFLIVQVQDNCSRSMPEFRVYRLQGKVKVSVHETALFRLYSN